MYTLQTSLCRKHALYAIYTLYDNGPRLYVLGHYYGLNPSSEKTTKHAGPAPVLRAYALFITVMKGIGVPIHIYT
jgi:hypothetical protein